MHFPVYYSTESAWSVPPHSPNIIYSLSHSEHPLTTYLRRRWQEQKAQKRHHSKKPHVKTNAWSKHNTIVTNRGLYEPKVMYFRMTNSPATFQALEPVRRTRCRMRYQPKKKILFLVIAPGNATVRRTLPLSHAKVSRATTLPKINTGLDLYFSLSHSAKSPEE